MDWAIIVFAVLVVIAAVLLRQRFGHIGKAAVDACGRALGDKGRRYAINGFYAATVLLWIALFLWATEDDRGGWQAILDRFKGPAPKP